MRARYYDPQTQQFLSRDPLGVPNQPYVYANRNPINYIDPTGTQAVPGGDEEERPVTPGQALGEEGLAVPGGGGGGGAAEAARQAEGIPRFQLPNSRHYIQKVRQKTITHSDVNTVIEPGVDVAADLEAINSGKAIRNNQEFEINGRRYGVHGKEGRIYPISGPGFRQLSRGAYKVLGILNTLGNTELAQRAFTGAGYDELTLQAGFDAWRAGGGR